MTTIQERAGYRKYNFADQTGPNRLSRPLFSPHGLDRESGVDHDKSVMASEVRVMCVAGARPNFVKVGPLLRELAAQARFSAFFVNTGQHVDAAMAANFLHEFGLPAPMASLNVGSGTHAAQTAAVMSGLEPVLEQLQPHVVLVVGDVNSTLAAALTAAKFRLREPFRWRLERDPRHRPIVAHVEAGLRSADRDMPEEINRLATDAISDILFTTEPSATANLAREGVASERTFFVGNVMIDALVKACSTPQAQSVLTDLGLAPRGYAVVTLHRPSNVDDGDRFAALVTAISRGVGELPAIFPSHPRTRARNPGRTLPGSWREVEPMGYAAFTGLLAHAAVVCTDSGGVQEETSFLGTPCVTLRTSTERPVTIFHGTNHLAGVEPAVIADVVQNVLAQPLPQRPAIPLWDGAAASRIVEVLHRVMRA